MMINSLLKSKLNILISLVMVSFLSSSIVHANSRRQRVVPVRSETSVSKEDMSSDSKSELKTSWSSVARIVGKASLVGAAAAGAVYGAYYWFGGGASSFFEKGSSGGVKLFDGSVSEIDPRAELSVDYELLWGKMASNTQSADLVRRSFDLPYDGIDGAAWMNLTVRNRTLGDVIGHLIWNSIGNQTKAIMADGSVLDITPSLVIDPNSELALSLRSLWLILSRYK